MNIHIEPHTAVLMEDIEMLSKEKEYIYSEKLEAEKKCHAISDIASNQQVRI